jgi:hypothetical protein
MACSSPVAGSSSLGTTTPVVEGRICSGSLIAGVGTGGRVCLYTYADTHLVVDVNGAFPGTILPPPSQPLRVDINGAIDCGGDFSGTYSVSGGNYSSGHLRVAVRIASDEPPLANEGREYFNADIAIPSTGDLRRDLGGSGQADPFSLDYEALVSLVFPDGTWFYDEVPLVECAPPPWTLLDRGDAWRQPYEMMLSSSGRRALVEMGGPDAPNGTSPADSQVVDPATALPVASRPAALNGFAPLAISADGREAIVYRTDTLALKRWVIDTGQSSDLATVCSLEQFPSWAGWLSACRQRFDGFNALVGVAWSHSVVP